jgi:hypothetical protein
VIFRALDALRVFDLIHARQQRVDFQETAQKMLRIPIATPVWLLRPGSSTVPAPVTLLKSTVP